MDADIRGFSRRAAVVSWRERLRQCIHNVEAYTCHFHQFFEWNGGSSSQANGVHKGCRASSLSLILAPEVHLAESRPPIAVETPKVIELENAPRAKDLQPFFGERLVAVREIMHGPYRSVRKAESEA